MPEEGTSYDRLTSYLPEELIEETKNAAYHYHGGQLSKTVRIALEQYMRKLKKKHKVVEIPWRDSELSPGRKA